MIPWVARRMAPRERFFAYVVAGANGCWLWTGLRDRDGYGRFKVNGKRRPAHRWNYEQSVGLVPDGLEIDHLCRTPRCVNPAHMEAVTPLVNNLRGDSPTAINARKTRCIHGHPFDETNTYIKPSGARVCRACALGHAQRYRVRQRAAKESS